MKKQINFRTEIINYCPSGSGIPRSGVPVFPDAGVRSLFIYFASTTAVTKASKATRLGLGGL